MLRGHVERSGPSDWEERITFFIRVLARDLRRERARMWMMVDWDQRL